MHEYEYIRKAYWIWIHSSRGDIWSLFFGYAVKLESDILATMPRGYLPNLLWFGFLAIQKDIQTHFLKQMWVSSLLLIIKNFLLQKKLL